MSDLVEIELIRDIVVILVTCKNEEDPLKNKDARVATTHNIDIFKHSRADNSAARRRIWSNLNSSKILWTSLLLPRIKNIRIKMKALEWPQH